MTMTKVFSYEICARKRGPIGLTRRAISCRRRSRWKSYGGKQQESNLPGNGW